MANTYTKIYLHIVFAVKDREALLPPLLQKRIYSYMATVLRDKGHFPVTIGGTENHVHILIDYAMSQPIPDMVRELKTCVTKLINTNHLIPFQFAWQRGYACFSYSASQVAAVKNYIDHQAEHHDKMTLREEMAAIYQRFGVEYDEKYVFEGF